MPCSLDKSIDDETFNVEFLDGAWLLIRLFMATGVLFALAFFLSFATEEVLRSLEHLRRVFEFDLRFLVILP